MDTTLGLRGGGKLRGFPVSGSNAASKGEQDSDASSYPVEADLELGLSLGGGMKSRPTSVAARGEHRRFLIAKDLPSAVRDRDSSSIPSAAPLFPITAAVSGTKRAADSAVQEVASSPPPVTASQVVGWPPIRAYRMHSLVMNQAKPLNPEEEGDKPVDAENSKFKDTTTSRKKAHSSSIGKKSTSIKEKGGHLGVKVNVDGLMIGRKVDLNSHTCYESLALALEGMFFRSTNNVPSNHSSGEKEHMGMLSKMLDGSSEFVLTYEDKEGDWMLVGDVPWEMFLNNVRRLRIMKTSEANGLCT